MYYEEHHTFLTNQLIVRERTLEKVKIASAYTKKSNKKYSAIEEIEYSPFGWAVS